jgi:AraC-like DNA-binding protein
MTDAPPPARAHHAAATPVAFVHAILAGYRRHGAAPDAALRHARIGPALLADPDGRITAAQLEALSGFAMQQLDDEALGWFGRRLPWGSYGMLCRASTGAPTLGRALRRWCRHHRLLTDEVLLSLEADGGRATLAVREARPLAPAVREFALVSLLRFALGYACWAIDSRIALASAGFPYPAPAHAGAYAVLFEAAGGVAFDAEHASFAFDARYLAMPLRRDEAALDAMLRRALPLTVRPYRRDRLAATRARELLRARPGAAQDAEGLAALLHVSRRTLYRQLRASGTTPRALQDEVRRERAEALLRRTARPIKQVAAAVGFGDAKSFSRAFKAWTGIPPAAWRRQAGAPSGDAGLPNDPAGTRESGPAPSGKH